MVEILRQLYSTHSRPLIAYVAVFIALCTFHLTHLFSAPPWFVDEALTANRVHALATTGSPVGAIDREAASEAESHGPFVQALPYLIFLVPHRLFPAMEIIESMRVSSFMAGMLLLAAVGVIGWRFISPIYGAASMIICGLSSAFSMGSHIARPDIFAAAVGFCGLALYSPRPFTTFLSVFLAAFSIAFHQRGLILLITLLAVLMVDIVSRKTSRLNVSLAFSGVIAGLGCFYLINISSFSSLEAFTAASRWIATIAPPPVIGATGQDWWGILLTLRHTSEQFYPSIGLFILAPVIALVVAESRICDVKLKVMVVVGLVAGFLLMNGLVPVKVVIVSPLLDLAMAAALTLAFSLAAKRSQWRFPAIALSLWFAIITCFAGASDLTRVESMCREESSRVSDFLRSHIPPSAKVIGEESFWIYLRNNRYQSWKDVPLQMQVSGRSFAETMTSTRSDYLIFDDGMASLLLSKPRDPFHRALAVSPEDMRVFLQSFSSTIGKLETACYGRVIVYSLTQGAADS